MEIKLRNKPPRQSGPKKKPRGLPFPKGRVYKRGPMMRTTCELPKGTREAFTVLSDLAFEALRNILDDPYHPRHEQASEYVLNQKWGTARQSIDLNDPNGTLAGRHEVRITFANVPNGVELIRTPEKSPDGSPVPWNPGEAKALETPATTPEPEPEPAPAEEPEEAVVISTPGLYLPWEAGVAEDDDE